MPRALRIIFLCGLLGCGGDKAAPPDAAADAPVATDSPGPDLREAAAPDRAPVDAAPDAPPDAPRDSLAADAAPSADLGPAPVALPLPASVKPPQRLLGPTDRLTGEGPGVCSNPDRPTADRWCVFARSGAVATLAELWIINVTKAAAGNVPRCDGSSADCVRLTSTLWTGFSFTGAVHPFSHQFHGDTLFFYADSTSGSQDNYVGGVSAWRPGWTQPRVITSPKGFLCFGHQRRPLAFCIDDLEGSPMKPESFELRAGSLDTPGPLPSLGRIRPFRTGGGVAWQAGFSPDGELFAVSSLEPDPEVEVLRVLPTSGIGTTPLRVVLEGGTSWAIANDSKRIYYFRPEVDDLHTLHAADFPSGAGEVKLGTGVRDYLVLGEGTDQGVAFLAQVNDDTSAFRFVRDSRTPASLVTLFTYRDLLEGVIMSDDLRYTAWLDGRFVARVVRTADLSSCRLNIFSPTSAYSPAFLGSGGLALWSEDVTATGNLRDGFYGRPDDCGGKQRFATAVAFYVPLGDRGVVYADESDGVQRASLKYAAVKRTGDSWSLETPVRVHDKTDESSFILVGSPPTLVLYTTSGPEGGTWVFGPLPF